MIALLLWSLLAQSPPAPDIEGLWAYESIGRAGGKEVPIAGSFLFCHGYTVQSSLNAGEPYDRQLAQAHFGSYRIANQDATMISTIGLVFDPAKDPPLDTRRNVEHHAKVERAGERLTVTFSTGTVQRFKLAGRCSAPPILFREGALALVDGQFVLVAEVGDRALAGSGTYERTPGHLKLRAERWFSLNAGRARYLPATVIDAEFDGKELRVPGEPVLHVKEPDRKP